jgi:hypothetical protein
VDGLLSLDNMVDNIVAASPKFAPAEKIIELARDDVVRFRARIEVLCAAAKPAAPAPPASIHV